MSLKDPQDRDPISDAAGAHQAATGIGSAGGAVAGAALGSVAGRAGAIAGAVAGGVAGKGTAHIVNPSDEDRHWSEAYSRAPYYASGRTYEDYRPAYGLGYNARSEFHGSFDDAEARLSREWERIKGRSRLTWDQARYAARDAWDRVTR
ncbi:MAG: hypothetical protein ACXWCU_14360 [Caldimonas sp.]